MVASLKIIDGVSVEGVDWDTNGPKDEMTGFALDQHVWTVRVATYGQEERRAVPRTRRVAPGNCRAYARYKKWIARCRPSPDGGGTSEPAAKAEFGGFAGQFQARKRCFWPQMFLKSSRCKSEIAAGRQPLGRSRARILGDRFAPTQVIIQPCQRMANCVAVQPFCRSQISQSN